VARGRRSSGGKPNKAEQLRERSKGLQAHQFHRFLDEVSAKRQELNDANTEHASAWKQADALGIHPRAAKQIARLDKMDALKRQDELRSFDQMRGFMAERWGAEPDIYEQPPATPLEAAIEERSGGGDDDPPSLGDLVNHLVEDAANEDGPKPAYDVASPPDLPGPDVALEADWGEDGADAASPELDNAGYTFANGRAAGRDGKGPEANPHAATSPSHAIWERGRAQGAAAGDDDDLYEAVGDDSPPVEETPKKRGRRRSSGSDAAGAAAVH
jgi:uncharacterized protein (UPF0335 family)